MDMALNRNDASFRDEVRGFLKAKLPREIAEAHSVGISVEKPLLKTWQRILHAQGWVAPAWPKEYGGTGWTTTQRRRAPTRRG